MLLQKCRAWNPNLNSVLHIVFQMGLGTVKASLTTEADNPAEDTAGGDPATRWSALVSDECAAVDVSPTCFP